MEIGHGGTCLESQYPRSQDNRIMVGQPRLHREFQASWRRKEERKEEGTHRSQPSAGSWLLCCGKGLAALCHRISLGFEPHSLHSLNSCR